MTRVMLPEHHPDEAVLLDYAAGNLPSAFELVLATHLALCPACRKEVARMEALGGAAMADLAPADIPAGLLHGLMERLGGNDEGDEEGKDAKTAGPAPGRTAAPKKPGIPEPLRSIVKAGFEKLDWHGIGGVEIHALKGGRTGPKSYLMRIAGGAKMPSHTHRGTELTLVLEGGFSDALGAYARGDLAQTDESHTHTPVADPEGCVCLIATQHPLRMGGPISGLVARWFGV